MKETDCLNLVWGNGALPTNNAVKSAVKKANRALMDVACRLQIHRENGFISLQ